MKLPQASLIWASRRQGDSNQPPQLLAIKLKISRVASLGMFIIVNNEGADKSAQMHIYEHSENGDILLIFS